jgi:hypothetical protein
MILTYRNIDFIITFGDDENHQAVGLMYTAQRIFNIINHEKIPQAHKDGLLPLAY